MPETPRTVAELTPMLRHYLDLKAQHPEAVLLYRMGDFYEMFFEDALRAAPILEVTLTARHRGSESETPMCGVPHHALEPYLAKLIRAGLKVAICDQMEDAAQAKGLVRREITRIVTPGTLAEPGLLEGKEENLLAALAMRDGEGAVAYLDSSTGAFSVRRCAVADLAEELAVSRPRELLVDRAALPAALAEAIDRQVPCVTALAPGDWPSPREAGDQLLRQLGVGSLRGFGLSDGEPAVVAAAAALDYAHRMQRRALGHVRDLAVREERASLVLDAATLANLEVFELARDGVKRPSLLGVVDRTQTAGGGRTIREWLRRPLRDADAIRRRLRAVADLVEHPELRERLRQRLARVGDLDRLLGRAVLGTLAPREAAALRDSLAEIPALQAEISTRTAPLLVAIARVDPLAVLHADLERMLQPVPSAQIREGGVIAAGVDQELDGARSLARNSKEHVANLEGRERQRTGIASLKIRYNKVFGYTIEITSAHRDKTPQDYTRKQTLANAERFVTPELKDLEERIVAAEERQIALEERYFAELRERIAGQADALRELARAIASLDVLASFAEVAARNDYREPTIGPAGGVIQLQDARHPIVEAVLSSRGEPFVPNDAELDAERNQLVVLTGPNMGGKSTYLRQVALIVLLAQAGSFVPARAAEIGLVDRIFTRVGASDDLARGESTFMVEMIETANILRHATPASLVILDEVGRGTATFDGLSLAWAVAEHLHERVRARTLFATHYHELTELASYMPRIVNRTMAVKEWQDKIVFLRRVVPGSADKSYGLHVARLAGLPASVLERAAAVLANLESHEYDPSGVPRLAEGAGAPAPAPSQMGLFQASGEVVLSLLRDLQVEELTPLAALNLLHTLKSRLAGR
jgi:DNA mismatch repair protein MutS